MAPLIYVLYYSGEFNLNLNKINKLNSYHIGFRYSNESKYKKIKLWNIETNKTFKILALGSSRVLQFRDSFFQCTFYNAGYTISKIQDFESFLKSTPKNKYPKLLIIGLDQWMFNKNWSKDNLNTQLKKYNSVITKESLMQGIKPFLIDLFHQNLKISGFSDPTKIGVDAKSDIKGFRKDGSLFYIKQTNGLLNFDTTVNDFMFSNTKDRIRQGNRRFEHGDSVNNDAIYLFKRFLNFCNSNSIYVIAFLPPFAPSIYSEMKTTNRMNYIFQVHNELKKHTNTYKNFELYDFSNIGDDSWFYDGFHGSEFCYSNILLQMVRQKSKLLHCVDTIKLRNSIKNAPNQLQVFKD